MSFRTTGILLGVLVVLSAVVFWAMRQPAPSAAGTATTQTQVFQVKPADLQKMTITAGNKSTILQHDSHGWRLTAPSAGPADPTRSSEIATDLSDLTAQRVIPHVADFGMYGLATPAISVTVDLTGGKTLNLDVGDATPDKSANYARVPGQSTVYLIGSIVASDLKDAVANPPKALPTPSAMPSGGPIPTP